MCVGGTCCNNEKCGLCGTGEWHTVTYQCLIFTFSGDDTVHRIANPTNEKQQRKVTGGGGRYW